MSHAVEVCAHGDVVRQCRCMKPHKLRISVPCTVRCLTRYGEMISSEDYAGRHRAPAADDDSGYDKIVA